MRKSMKIGAAVVVLMTVVFAGGAAIAVAAPQGVGSGRLLQRMPEGPLRRFLMGELGRAMTLKADLNLTEAQREQMRSIVMSHKAEITPIIHTLSDKRRALRDATWAESLDETAIRNAAGDLSKAIGDAAVQASRIKAEARKVLTADQLKMVSTFRTETDSAIDQLLGELSKAK